MLSEYLSALVSERSKKTNLHNKPSAEPLSNRKQDADYSSNAMFKAVAVAGVVPITHLAHRSRPRRQNRPTPNGSLFGRENPRVSRRGHPFLTDDYGGSLFPRKI